MSRPTFSIDPMTLPDIPAVLAVEQASYSMAWPEKAYDYELTQNRLAHYFVLRHSGPPLGQSIMGMAGFWLMADEIHISTVAVLPRWRRLGWGEWLLIGLLEHGLALGGTVATLEVRPSNQAAIALYHKYLFAQVGRRPRYYDDNHEDALILTTPPLAAPNYQAMLARRKNALTLRLASFEPD